jgi:uncharacterized protein YkwD
MNVIPAKVLVTAALLTMLTGCAGLGVLGNMESAASLNEFRTAHGLKPLRIDASLTAMAQAHAADMARRNALDHAGFMERRGPAGARAENVAFGCRDTACTIRIWIKSPRHRANMLRTDVTRYGLASAQSTSGKRYWALLVGE